MYSEIISIMIIKNQINYKYKQTITFLLKSYKLRKMEILSAFNDKTAFVISSKIWIIFFKLVKLMNIL